MDFPLKQISTVLFDLDGTMVDSVPDLHACLNGMLAGMGLGSLGIPDVRMIVGRGTHSLVRSAIALKAGDGEADQRINEGLTGFYREYRQINGTLSTVYPGVIEGLAAMKEKGFNLCCVTNKPSPFTEPLLASKGLLPFFDFVSCSDTFPLKKPDPFPVLMCLSRFSATPEQAVLIGDSENDGKAAKAAGTHLFMVPYGYNYGNDPAKLGPDAIVSSVLEASKLIERS